MNYEIDKLDKQILTMLMQDVTRPYTDIAKELSVSGGTIHVRMKKLNELGVVKGSQLLVNPTAVGYDICAFIGVFLEKGSEYKEAVAQMRQIPEIVELHYTTGSYSMFAKIICRDTQHLRETLNEKMQTIPGVQRTETFISLEESINRQVAII
ncbi:Lrp/AsnC ligand binding domain-containing protein [Pontibacter vulgaris]|uniref:Lrp/AsnC ligand binding domain-containing protein n=1 Tax=Pontibacter vulgaris TaxID=2905679 RepID=UPI001FA78F7D|nr:Lrp/AsnC ligand binding domain-containing protein [Pontibacter vulgaris]